MDFSKNINNFRKRFNQVIDFDEGVNFTKFKNIFENIIDNIFLKVGVEINDINTRFSIYIQERSNKFNYNAYLNIKLAFKEEFNEIDYYEKVNAITFALKQYARLDVFNTYIDLLSESLSISLVNLRLIKDKSKELYEFFPKGQKELDEKLVDQPFSFLDSVSRQHFIEAIKYFQKNSLPARIKAAEQLRRTLEEFLKHKLKNTKGLDSNITELQKVLKRDFRDPQVRKTIYLILNYLDKYFNENSKHNDGDINEIECEFLVYQTGVLLRFIDESISN